jgi:hypothetical protein
MRVVAGVLVLGALSASAAPQETPPETRKAVARAIQYFVDVQDDTGAIRDGRKVHHTALTSLAILAMAAAGHQPKDATPEGRAMKRALEFVLEPDRMNADGYFGEADYSRMYGHGMTALMLAEMLGMGVDDGQNRLIRDRLTKAVALILRAQSAAKDPDSQGGWRYTPEAADADLSVTAWQVLVLRAAKNAGLSVPKEAVDAAVGFVKRCFAPKGEGQGAFTYQPGKGVTPSMASAGLLTLQLCGHYDDREVRAVSDWLLAQRLDPQQEWFYYAVYYFSQALRQRGGDAGLHARRHVNGLLVPLQGADGAWTPLTKKEAPHRVYATSMAVLALSLENGYLPIYER